jgi:UDP-N-acetylmuramoyl-L-alanyl-D-glutamate--2,6-diaminopimelate ligase
MHDIVINSKKVKKGDIFFCQKSAEHYLDLNIISLADKIYVEDGFSQRNKYLYNKQNTKHKIVQELNYRQTLIAALKERYIVPKNLIAITGTKGKTSSCYFIFQLLELIGINAAYFGTIGIYCAIDGKIQKLQDSVSNLTTFDIDELYRSLDLVKSKGIDFVAFEVSSHALEQSRIEGLDIKVRGFSNFSQDHLDYHKTLENYLNSKCLLFKGKNNENSYAILNNNLPESVSNVAKNNGFNIISFGKQVKNELLLKNFNNQDCNNKSIKILSCTLYNNKQFATVEYLSKNYILESEIIGDFQIENIILAILAVHCATDCEIEKLFSLTTKIKAAPGRLERIKDRNIFVDYAHTPESLFKTLITIRDFKSKTASKIVTVFGCGGNRDRDKRPIMGAIAYLLSDIIIVTSDNPRNENPEDIIQDILSFQDFLSYKNSKRFSKSNNFDSNAFIADQIAIFQEQIHNLNIASDKKQIIIEKNRAAAIKLSLKNKDDIILVAGKGHETYQIIGDKTQYFSDKEEIEKHF